MKKTLRALCVSMCLLSIFAFILSGCNIELPFLNNNSTNTQSNKQIPVYQGMSISTSASVTMPSFEKNGNNGNGNGNGNTDNNGNHYGWYKGDSADDKGDVDQETPFPDANENIEQEVKDSLEVIGSKQEIYYAAQNQDVYIHIYISNPDQFEILSFTLNGQKYSSYMFESGSTQELLILKYNVGDAHGIVEYTIDQIKYIDGTEIKDVKIGGDRTVKAGIRTEDQVTATVTNLQIGTNSVSFNATIADKDNLIAYNNGIIKAVLFDGDTLVAEKELTLGSNAVAFENLKNGTVYQYAIVACYDNLTGDAIGFHVLAKKAFQTNNIVLFDNIVVGQDKIDFTFKWDESVANKALTSLKLYKDGELVTALETNATTASGPLSANEYVLVAEYQDLGQPTTISLTFATLEKGVPSISIINPTKTQTSVGFEIVETDVDNVGTITKIELVHANKIVVADSLEQRTFENLLSGNDYTVKVTYAYDMGDGSGEQIVITKCTISTIKKVEPRFVIENEDITTESILAEYSIVDLDCLLSNYKVELYNGNILVLESSDKEINFTGLNYYSNYVVRFTYGYDLNDGNGEQTKIYDYSFKTLPYIDVTECDIANTSAVSAGEKIFMSVEFDNPLGMTVESVVVNGETYGVTGASTKNKIFLEIVNDGQFVGGNTCLKIDRINAKIDNKSIVIEPQNEISDDVFINGKIEVLKIEFVNNDFEIINWAFPSDIVYVLLTLDNPTGYTVDAINETTSGLVRIDNNRWYYTATLCPGWNTESINSISYHNEYTERTRTQPTVLAKCYAITSDEIKYISTPNDLKNMNGGYYYELTNDIDLAGLEWLGYSFEGVFNGKGYSIKNMSYVGTVKNTDAYIGLFSHGCGFIRNVNISEATIVTEIMSDNKSDYIAYVGGIVAYSSNTLNIHNCTIDEYSIYTVKNTVGIVYVGSIVGYVNNGITITNCINNGNVSATTMGFGDWSIVGGIVGKIGTVSDTITITNCTNSGNVSAIGESVWSFPVASGIVGSVARDVTITITNCTNSGNIKAISADYTEAGGMIGRVENVAKTITITNCINSGNISATSQDESASAGGMIGSPDGGVMTVTIIANCINSGDIRASAGSERRPNVGGIIGWLDNDAPNILTGNYSLPLQGSGYNGNSCTIDQLNSKSFYTEILGWSEDVWDFSELDFANGKYPKLK